MDPAAKRFLWRVIAGLRDRTTSTTTIITTHSMEECEAVSQRIGILVAGVRETSHSLSDSDDIISLFVSNTFVSQAVWRRWEVPST